MTTSNITSIEPQIDPKEESGLNSLLALVLGFITLTTISGNSVVLYLFYKSKRSLRSPTHWLIANLAFADLLVGLIVMPAFVSITINNLKWILGDIACSSNEYIHFCLCATSMLSMMAVSLERYIGVRFPLRHKRILNRRRVLKLLGLIWILGITLTATPLTIWPSQEVPLPKTCPVNLRESFIFFISISVYCIPVTVTAFTYWMTYRTAVKLFVPPPGDLNKQINFLSSSTTSTCTTALSSSATGKGCVKKSRKSDEERYMETKQKQTKLAKKLGYVVVIMVLLYGPLFIILLLKSFHFNFVTIHLLLIFGWLRYFCSCVNPFVNILVVPGYKKAFFKMVCNTKRPQTENNNTTDPTDQSSSTTGSGSSAAFMVRDNTGVGRESVIVQPVGQNNDRVISQHLTLSKPTDENLCRLPELQGIAPGDHSVEKCVPVPPVRESLCRIDSKVLQELEDILEKLESKVG